jgi:hypothetical protein
LTIKGVRNVASITEIADKFFVACEAGKGWEACKVYCTPVRHSPHKQSRSPM